MTVDLTRVPGDETPRGQLSERARRLSAVQDALAIAYGSADAEPTVEPLMLLLEKLGSFPSGEESRQTDNRS